MGAPDVWILGGYLSDFARNLDRAGLDFAALTAEIVESTLAAARLDGADIGVVHVANAFGESFAHQGHLGAMPATVNDGLWGTPAVRHEAGVRMLLDAARQVSGTAGDYQIDDAKRFATLNFGGSTATTVSFVVGRTP